MLSIETWTYLPAKVSHLCRDITEGVLQQEWTIHRIHWINKRNTHCNFGLEFLRTLHTPKCLVITIMLRKPSVFISIHQGVSIRHEYQTCLFSLWRWCSLLLVDLFVKASARWPSNVGFCCRPNININSCFESSQIICKVQKECAIWKTLIQNR